MEDLGTKSLLHARAHARHIIRAYSFQREPVSPGHDSSYAARLFPTERLIQSRKYPALFFFTAADLFPNRQNSLTELFLKMKLYQNILEVKQPLSA